MERDPGARDPPRVCVLRHMRVRARTHASVPCTRAALSPQNPP